MVEAPFVAAHPLLIWLPLLTFLAHMLEEFPGFPSWATRHFGATSRAWYVYSHVVLVAIIVAICRGAGLAQTMTWSLVILVATSWTLACNALFHLVTTWMFREYSPGVVTGTFLFLPATGYSLWLVRRLQLLSTSQVATAIAIGTLVQVAVVASLWLRMDFDWLLRTPGPRGRRADA